MKHSLHPFGPVRCSSCTIRELVDTVNESAREPNRPGFVINFINAHLFNLCWTNEELRERINTSDIVAADGMAIVWAARLFGFTICERCNMTDAFRTYLAQTDAPNARAILVGGSQDEADRAARTMNADAGHLHIDQTISGFLTLDEYRSAFAAMTYVPDLILLGMGSPKTEQIAVLAAQRWPNAVVWHIGGGTIMFFAGRLIEAPEWMRKCGLQWLHRLCIEPGRMWRRYVLGNPLFVIRVLASAVFQRGPEHQNMAD